MLKSEFVADRRNILKTDDFTRVKLQIQL